MSGVDVSLLEKNEDLGIGSGAYESEDSTWLVMVSSSVAEEKQIQWKDKDTK